MGLAEVYSPVLFNEYAMQLGLDTRVAAVLATGWNLETKSLQEECSSQLRSERPNVLIASPPCPSLLVLQNFNGGISSPLESEGKRVITETSLLIFVTRERSEQMHRGDTSPSNIHQMRLHGKNNAVKTHVSLAFAVRQIWVCERETTSLLTNHLGLAEALMK